MSAVLFGLGAGVVLGVPWALLLFIDEDRRRVRAHRRNRLDLTRSLSDRIQ